MHTPTRSNRSTPASRPHPVNGALRHLAWHLWLRSFGATLAAILVGGSARAATTTPALVEDLLVTRWTVEDGLPLDHLNALALASDGALWVASYDGLVRFDGLRFEVLRKSNEPRLPSNRFTHVAASPDSAIWARAESGELVRIVDKGLETFTVEALEGAVSALVVSRDRLFALSEGGPLELTRGAPKRVFAMPSEWGGAMTGLAEGDDGRFWVTTERGLFEYPARRQLIARGGLEVLGIVGLGESGELWIGGAGLYRVSTATGRVIDSPAGFDDVCAIAARPGAPVEVRDRSGWWRLRDAEPPLRLVSDEVSHCDVASSPGVRWRIAGRGVLREDAVVFRSAQPATAILPGPDGGVWVATRSGLVRLHSRPVTGVATPPGWSGPSVDLIHRDRRGGLWVASLTEGLARVSPPLIVELPARLPNEPRPLVLGLVEHADGRLEVGTDAGRCNVENLGVTSGRCVPVTDAPAGAGVLVPLLVDGRGRTLYGGLGAWVKGAGELHAMDPDRRWRALRPSDGKPIRYARSAASGPGGIDYIATADQGLVLVRGDAVEVLDKNDGLSSDRLRSLHVDPRGDLWIGTEDAGLCRYRVGSGFECVDVGDGLDEDVVHAILPDPMNRLWLSGNRGLAWVRVDAVERVFAGTDVDVLAVNLDTRDGMMHREGNGILPRPAASDGQRLYFATQGGVAVVDPRLAPEIEPPVPGVREVSVAQRAWSGDEVTVGSGEGLELIWSAPMFSHSDDLRFRVRLGDENWGSPGRATRASWASLPPGRSIIEVQAGLGGLWSDRTLRLVVVRTPRFIETAWFPVVVGGSVFVALSVLVLSWYSRQRKVRARLEAEVSRRTADLSTANASLATKTAEVERQAARLAELNELRQRFVADLSHELRTPLSLVEGPIEDLVAALPLDVREAHRPRLDLIRANVARLEVLSEQLLDVARLEGGKVPLRVKRHALGTFIAAIVARFSPAFAKKQLSLRFEAQGDGPVVYFDGDLLDKVVTNLLANALKFTSRGGVTVGVRLVVGVRGGDEGAVEVRVSDTGIGIDLTRNPSLFTRFYQVDRGDARRFEGVGIGLALVSDLVALHGGEVGVESAVGRGASFWFTLPLGAAHVAVEDIDLRPAARYDAGLIETKLASFENLPSPGRSGLPRVLLVEDHPDMRAYLAMHLSEHFEVIEADGGEAALEILTLAGATSSLPVAIVSDVMMPGLDGLALAKKLKSMPPMDTLPLLLVSAKAGDEDRVAGLAVADDYLTKPVRPRELVARLKRLIAKVGRNEVISPPVLEAAGMSASPPAPERPRRPTSEVVLTAVFPEGVPSRPSVTVERLEVPDSRELEAEGEVEVEAVPLEPATDAASLRQRARLDALIEERLSDESFGVIELAAALGSSRRQLQREVRRLTGEAPSDYLRRRRMERAQELLSSGARDTVAEVAAAVGLSPAYFSRLYAVWFGRSPSDDLARRR